ncbi:MAG: hypothetical protein M3452_05345 [Chloroflexota bacterium]|nr:hypothetical protein [Chloroflexota bacterium]
MSRGHSASRRRNYGPRQRDVRRRAAQPVEMEPRTSEWPGTSAWSEANEAREGAHEQRQLADGEGVL